MLTSPISIYSQNEDSLPYRKLNFSTSFLDYLANSYNTRNLNLGTEYNLKNRNSISLNIGFLKSFGASRSSSDFSSLFQIPTVSTQGFKIQLEKKHYLNLRTIFWPSFVLFCPHALQYKSQELQNTGYYIAGNIFFQNTVTKRSEAILNPVDQFISHIYSVSRNVYSANFKFGYQCIKKYGLIIDYSIGFGAQYISSNSKDKIGDATVNPDRDFPWRKSFDNGSGLYPHFCYQLKVGWMF